MADLLQGWQRYHSVSVKDIELVHRIYRDFVQSPHNKMKPFHLGKATVGGAAHSV